MERRSRYLFPQKATLKGSAGVRTNPAGSQTTNTKLVVAAIDFGTTYSGYAYSFYSDYKDDHLKMYANQAWSADGEGLVTMKTPTIVLFDKEDKFHSFGFEAEKKYIDLAIQENHKGWKYFRRFKMKLNERMNLKRTMTLIDEQDKPKPAKEVFAAAIKYLKEHLLKRVQQAVPSIISTDIFWVLTVPAIWHDGARQFMVESAHLAGIPENQLTLALEPECAAIYCKEQAVNRKFTERAELASFNPGCQFMIIDLGGGTVDITTHEVDSEGNLREIMAPTGGPWGGTQVDMAFDILMAEMFTKTVIQIFGRECKDDQLDLQRIFELKKRSFNKGDAIVQMRFPSGLFDVYRENCPVDFQTSIKRGSLAETVLKKRDKLIINSQKITDLFKKPKDELLTHLSSLLSQSNMRNVSTLLLVGGFAESHVMSDAIRDAFPHKHVITPSDAGLAVVKGAVMYGHNMDSISSRKMPYTIGISTAIPYNDRIHPGHKKVVRNGMDRCEDVFKVFVKKDQEIIRGKTTVEHTFNCPDSNVPTVHVEVYRSSNPEPRFVTDEDCKRVGELVLKLEVVARDKVATVTVQMLFGNTQIELSAREHGSLGRGVRSEINFLR